MGMGMADTGDAGEGPARQQQLFLSRVVLTLGLLLLLYLLYI